MPRTLLVLLTALIAVSGCAAPAAETPAVSSLNVCTSSVEPSQLALSYAMANNRFAAEKLTVEVVEIDGGTNATNALIAGDVDICQTGGSSVVNAVAAGAELVIVGSLTGQYPYYLISRPEITDAAALKGGSIAVSSAGSSSDTAARLALDYFGLTPDQDVTITAIGGQSDRLAALEGGRISATLLSAPQAMLAMERGFSSLLNFAELSNPYQHNVIVTTRSYLAANPEIVRAYLRATSQSIAAMHQDRAGTVAVLADYLDLDPTANAKALELTFDEFVLRYLDPALLPSTAGLQALIDEAVEENAAAAQLTTDQLVDLSYLSN
jgi:NitT/TauT family transport system substrate-binding protein